MGKKITRERAVEAAQRLVSTDTEWRYEVVEARFEMQQWTVLFAVFSKQGTELDGPVVVIVDINGGASLGPCAL